MQEAQGAPPATPARRLPYDRHLRLAWAVLFWERFWPALWPVLAVAGIFAGLALLDLLPRLNPWGHLAVLAALALALIAALWRNFRNFTLPDRDQSRRRIERASGMPHRPLTALEDRHTAGGQDAAAKAVWLAHITRLRARVKQLRVGVPAAGIGRFDPWGARAIIALGVIIAFAVGGHDAPERLSRALVPDLAGDGKKPVATLDIWIAPPAYTGLPPIFLSGARAKAVADGPLAVPIGSTVLAQVNGGRDRPKLMIDKLAVDFEAIGAASHKISTELRTGEKLSVMQGRQELGAWPIRIVPDTPPRIDFQIPPARTERAALRIEFMAEDDYGIDTVKATIRRVLAAPADAPASEAPSQKLSEDAIELPLPVPGLSLKSARASSYHDLTAHPWAGVPVELQLEVGDAIGQTGRTEPFAMILPERIFNHPVARAIVEIRKELTLNPEERRKPSDALVGIASRPQMFYGDVVVYMSLRAAARRLIFDQRPSAVEPIQSLLWDTALRVEDGDVSIAERELREIERALQEALANNASDAEIERLMKELQRAIDRYLQSLLAQMQNPQRMEFAPMDPNARMMSRDDLQRMVERARDLARSGARDAARQMLSQLQEMLENLRMGMMSQQQMQANQQAQQMMRELQDLARQQRRLLDRSFRRQQGQQGQRQQGQQGQRQQGQQGQDGDEGDEDDDEQAAGQQESLRRQLGAMMRRMGEMGAGEIPRGFGRAERAMRDAARALGQGQPGEAIGPQSEALDQLQQGAQALMEQMGRQFGQGEGPGPGDDPQLRQQPPGRAMERRDPLGRPQSTEGYADNESVKVPEEVDIQRAREIFDELRRRAGEPSRPQFERDYIDRLLRRF